MKQIQTLIKSKPLFVFMKGTPTAPMCGFSRTVVQLLELYSKDYGYYDVLQDDSIRQGIKQFSNWPTIPQVFKNGEFIGGCDILYNMYENKELESFLKEK